MKPFFEKFHFSFYFILLLWSIHYCCSKAIKVVYIWSCKNIQTIIFILCSAQKYGISTYNRFIRYYDSNIDTLNWNRKMGIYKCKLKWIFYDKLFPDILLTKRDSSFSILYCSPCNRIVISFLSNRSITADDRIFTIISNSKTLNVLDSMWQT